MTMRHGARRGASNGQSLRSQAASADRRCSTSRLPGEAAKREARKGRTSRRSPGSCRGGEVQAAAPAPALGDGDGPAEPEAFADTFDTIEGAGLGAAKERPLDDRAQSMLWSRASPCRRRRDANVGPERRLAIGLNRSTELRPAFGSAVRPRPSLVHGADRVPRRGVASVGRRDGAEADLVKRPGRAG